MLATMDDPLLRRAHEIRLCSTGIRELETVFPEEDSVLEASLEKALAARDEIAFTRILLAASDASRSVDARLLAKGIVLLADADILIAVAVHMKGDLTDGVLKAVEARWLPRNLEATALYLGVWWCREREVPFPGALISQLRMSARRFQNDVLAWETLVAAAEILQDENLNSIMGLPAGGTSPRTISRFLNEHVAKLQASPLFILPESTPAIIASGYTVRRAAPRVGRNEPCPCGSGKKYKKCCIAKDEERLQHSSPVSGLTLEEYRQNQERYLTRERLTEMHPYELARLDPTKVSSDLLPSLVNQLNMIGEHEAVLSLFQRLDFHPELVGHWGDSVMWAGQAKKKGLVRDLLALEQYRESHDDRLPLEVRLLLLEDDAPREFLDLIERTAREVLTQDGLDADLPELAFALLEGPYPALGILVARSAIPVCDELEGMTLLDHLLKARDKLNLSPTDPFERISDRLFGPATEQAESESRELKEARDRLQSKNKEVEALNGKLRRLEEDLRETQRQQPAQPVQRSNQQKEESEGSPQPSDNEEKLRELGQRVEYLKTLLKERQVEKRELRQDLRQALGKVEELQSSGRGGSSEKDEGSSQDAEERLLGDEVPANQPIRFPQFDDTFKKALDSVPKSVATSAMALVGEMAAGFSDAFREAKQLKTRKAFFRQRVGSNYRLLFRFDSEALIVMNLIHRKDLERTIKSL